MAAASALFGCIGLFVHAARDLPTPTILAYRFLFSLVAFAGLAALSSRWRDAMRPHWSLWKHYVFLGLSIAAMNVAFYHAILQVGMGLATILIATTPVWVALGQWAIWRTPPGWAAGGGMAVGFTGVVLVVGTDLVQTSPSGVIAGLVAGIGFATWLLTSRMGAMHGASGVGMAVASVFVGGLLIMPVTFAFTPAVPAADTLLVLAGLGIVVGAGAVLLLELGLRTVDAERAAIIAYLEPVVAGVLGALVLQEAYTLVRLIGSALVIGGMIIVSLKQRPVPLDESRKTQMRGNDLPRQDS